MHTGSDHAMAQGDREYTFGTFRFIPYQQLLLRDDTPLRLGGRALDILTVLVERAGELVSKKELIAAAWPNSVVEDSNVKVHIAALRRALESGHEGGSPIATVSGRGYRFVAPVSCRKGDAPCAPEPQVLVAAHGLPLPATRMLGRAPAVAALLQTLGQHRMVSIVGPGGIGKTTLVLALAEAYHANTGTELCFVDLSPVSDPQFVAGALASALGMALHAEDGAQGLIASLRGRRLLLVLDSCEHVVETIAVLASRILGGAPGVTVLATSREPLRAAGEVVHRLAPLDYPPPAGTVTTAQQALEYPAVQLFVERAAECLEGYVLTDADAGAVAEICRRLEGVALAIELAAMRIDAFGARELAARLDDRFRLLKRGRRSAQPRHSTLAAALDWSYEFLPQDEATLLRQLSLFAGVFTLDAAIGLCATDPVDAGVVVDAVANLVAKSMLSADVGGAVVTYRLLDTTKAYALDKLDQRGEMDAMRRRHAEFYRALLAGAALEWGRLTGDNWLAAYGRSLDDVRHALAWAYSPAGDAAIGVALTVAAIPLWLQLSRLEECRHGVERALSGPHAAGDEMRLRAALGAAVLYARGPVAETDQAWMRVLALADQLGDREHQLRALWGMAVYRSYTGDADAVLALAERVRAITGDDAGQFAATSLERLIATALHYGGAQPAARSRLEQLLSRHVASPQRPTMAGFQLEPRSAALGTLANVLWLQGYPDQAVRTICAALEEARDADHAPSLLHVLAHAAFPVMMHVGDYGAAERLLDELSGHLAKLALPLWDSLLRCLRAVLQVRRGDASSLPLLSEALDERQANCFRLRVNSYLGTLAAALGKQGRHGEGLAVIGQALASCEEGEERWCHAELLRIKGELLEHADPSAAAQLYRQALELAGQQGALSWQLRAALSLAQLVARTEGDDAARLVLAPVYQRFSEGGSSADLRQAKAWMEGAVLGLHHDIVG
jgi:predicted ATPase/DNA-binding winged helix-turn-helix (wHTH) protein